MVAKRGLTDLGLNSGFVIFLSGLGQGTEIPLYQFFHLQRDMNGCSDRNEWLKWKEIRQVNASHASWYPRSSN